MSIASTSFGVGPDGEEVDLYTLRNESGVEVSITNYGGTVTSIKAPDRNGVFGDIVLGYETLDEYVKNSSYFGALIGRHANRIGRGKFSLNGVDYQLAQNDGANHLHGGVKGFDKRVWKATENAPNRLHLELLSEDGDENYPGNLNVAVDYALTEDNELRIEYHASTDQDTIVNLTNHSYFNLAGHGTILDHELTLHADSFTPVANDLIPTGEISRVDNTPLDFRTRHAIGTRIHEPFEQLIYAGGYDHNFCLRSWDQSLRVVAHLREPVSGRTVDVVTTQPGMQFYSGNFLDGSVTGKGGVVYEKYAGLCLEAQHYPDTPNQPNFPTTVLRADERYNETTIYRFTTD